MRAFATRLRPGQDLRDELLALARREELQAGFVMTCVGSLSRVGLRMAGCPETERFEADFEIVSLVGTLARDGAHLHMAASDRTGAIIGGHLQEGTIVRTTAEIVVGELTDLAFARPIDPDTGWDELEITHR